MTFLLDNIVLVVLALVSGGLLLWPKLSRRTGSTAVSPFEATQLINHRNAIVVDVRDETAFAAGSLAGARNVPVERVAELARFKSRPVVVVCASGQQSARALAAFQAQGFDEAYSLAGGLGAWTQASLPLVKAVGKDVARPASKDAARKARAEQRGKSRVPAAATVVDGEAADAAPVDASPVKTV